MKPQTYLYQLLLRAFELVKSIGSYLLYDFIDYIFTITTLCTIVLLIEKEDILIASKGELLWSHCEVVVGCSGGGK